MTLAEFKAWFEGFTESMEAAPTVEQFAKIKAKVALIDGTVTTYPVFISHFYRPYVAPVAPYWTNPIWAAGNVGYAQGMGVSLDAVGGRDADIGVGKITFDSIAAMNALGRADAASAGPQFVVAANWDNSRFRYRGPRDAGAV